METPDNTGESKEGVVIKFDTENIEKENNSPEAGKEPFPDENSEPNLKAKQELEQAAQIDLSILEGKNDPPPPAKTETVKTEAPKPEVKTAVKNEIPLPSMFDDLKKATEHDGKEKSKLAESLKGLMDDDIIDLNVSEEEDSPDIKKANASASSAGWVTAIDLGFSLLAMWAADDWANNNAYSLHENRKKAIRQNIYQIIMLKKKKSNPYLSLFGLVITAYIPMLVLAYLSGREKRKNKKLADLNRHYQQQNNFSNIDYHESSKEASRVMPKETKIKKEEIKIVQPTSTKGKQGRHKLGCGKYLGLACDCKR